MPLDFWRRLRGQAPLLSVVAIVVGAVIYLTIEPGHWRRGTGIIAGAMVLGAVLRLMLPPAHVGVLAVRGRYWDTLFYAGLGLLILAVDLRLRN